MKNQKFQNTDLQYDLKFDYDRTGCTCHEYICRCTRIINTRMEKVDPNNVIKHLMSSLIQRRSEIERYCFDRICYAFKIYDMDQYTIEYGGGYYGDEIYGVYFDNEEQVRKHYTEVCKLQTDIEKIQYCLELEYGYLLDSVKDAKRAYIAKVSTSRIHTPQTEYFKKVDANAIDTYKNRELPVAVCLKNGGNYRLIDGYHRFAANKNSEIISIIVLE